MGSSQSIKKMLSWWQKPLLGIVWVFILSICQLSIAQTENGGNEIDISFSEVSEMQIVGESSQLGIKFSATRENENDVVSFQLSNHKTVLLSRNVGTLNFYVMSNQLETATSFVAEDKESTAIDVLAEYLWRYRGYNELGDTLLDALLVLSNWPQGVAFAELEPSDPGRDGWGTTSITVTMSTLFGLMVNINTNGISNRGGGFVTTPNGIQCGQFPTGEVALCGTYLQQNESVILTATPASGYSFSGWSGDCIDTTTTCTVTMTSPKTVTANFTNTSVVPLSVDINTDGIDHSFIGGNVTNQSGTAIKCGNTGSFGDSVCSQQIALNQSVTLTATPAKGYEFSGWSGDCTTTTQTCTITMTSSKTVTAKFTKIPVYQLSVTISPNTSSGKVTPVVTTNCLINSAGTLEFKQEVSVDGINCGNGSTVCSSNLERDVTVTLTATPAAGYSFKEWSGACTGTSTTCTVSMTAAKSVTASFVVKAYALTITKLANVSSVSSSPAGINCGSVCSYNFQEGTNVTLTAIPKSGYKFTGWSGDCTGTTMICTVNMNASKSVTVTAR